MANSSADYPSEYLGTFTGKSFEELTQESLSRITFVRIIKPHSDLWALIALATALWGSALVISFLGFLGSFPGILGGFLVILAIATVVFIMSRNEAIRAAQINDQNNEDRNDG